MIKLYNNPNGVELSALQSSSIFDLHQTGAYEIAVKRRAFFGMMPSKISLSLHEVSSNAEVTVYQKLNVFSQRNTLSGARVVPVSEFQISSTGTYRLNNFDTAKFKEHDTLVITPKTGYKGFLLIFVIISSGILFIGGLVLTLLSVLKK